MNDDIQDWDGYLVFILLVSSACWFSTNDMGNFNANIVALLRTILLLHWNGFNLEIMYVVF